MKIRIFSDLHNEIQSFPFVQGNEDLIIAAGDIDNGVKGARWLMEKTIDIPIVYVAGNHEFYNHNYNKLLEKFKDLSKRISRFYFLENDQVIINNVCFLGCNLWTDFCLLGTETKDRSMAYCKHYINDYRKIMCMRNYFPERIYPEEIAEIHNKSINYLEKQLALNDPQKTIIITHHAPSKRSLYNYNRDDLLSCSFASNLEWLIKKYHPDLWIHGHTHFNIDYRIGDTRVLTNQKGYQGFEEIDDFIQYCSIET